MGYDLRPLDLIEEKSALLIKSSERKCLLVLSNTIPYLDATTVIADKGDFAVKDRFRFV
jgi:hypothetical protein